MGAAAAHMGVFGTTPHVVIPSGISCEESAVPSKKEMQIPQD